MDSVARPDRADRQARWAERLARRAARVQPPSLAVEGVLRRMVGLTLEAEGCAAPVGSRCEVRNPNGTTIEAEVVGFSGRKLYLMPTDDVHDVVPNARVVPLGDASDVPVGEGLLGRVLDGAGRPIDGAGPLRVTHRVPLAGEAINPLERMPIHEPLDVGVRAINALFTVGRGQRMGLFAGSGVGKSVLLGMMTRYTDADVVVVGLIGERGREVNEFVRDILGPEGRAKSVVVAAPADASPLMRLRGATLATRIAEDFRDAGKRVLLLMDSLTRFAQAQREIGLAIGEPPATKGYPPSVFARLPQLVERSGNGPEGGGSVTAFYTVLVEGDDQNDPVADAARAILDGHLVLSRELADAGHYPAIDVGASVSRVMINVVSPTQRAAAQQFQQLYMQYQRHRDLIQVGAYRRGSDPEVDRALEWYPRLVRFLRQEREQSVPLEDSVDTLLSLSSDEGEPLVTEPVTE